MQSTTIKEPNFIGIFQVDVTPPYLLSDDIENFVIDEDFPSKNEIITYYNTSPISYGDIYSVYIYNDYNSPIGKSLLEVIQ